MPGLKRVVAKYNLGFYPAGYMNRISENIYISI